jgi:hypothetical protein
MLRGYRGELLELKMYIKAFAGAQNHLRNYPDTEF